MSTNYVGDPTATQAPSSAPGPGVDPTVVIPSDGDALNSSSVAQAFKVLADFCAWATTNNVVVSLFSTGADGAASFSGGAVTGASGPTANVYTLTRDVRYTTMTVASGYTVKTVGYRIFCKTSCTVSAGGVVECSGKNGSNASGGTGGAGGAGAYSASQGSYIPGSSGGAGGNTTTNGTAGVDLSTFAPTVILAQGGGTGGTGGTASIGGQTGGAGGGADITIANTDSGILVPQWALDGMIPSQLMIDQDQTQFPFGGGTGGGGGGGGTLGAGGGGGGGGGVLLISARDLVVAGTVRANGGNGGTASSAASAGGGGGGGGVVLLVYATKTASGTIQAAGGSGGGSGAAGSAGVVVEFQLSA